MKPAIIFKISVIAVAIALVTSCKTVSSSSSAVVDGVQEIVTDYRELWDSVIVVKTGVPVKWYVNAPAGSLPTAGIACGKTIKIPGLGWGTDSYKRDEGHLTLVDGKNLVYEFTPTEIGEIQFCCWMGSECHGNVIHVTVDGNLDPGAAKPANSNTQHGHGNM